MSKGYWILFGSNCWIEEMGSETIHKDCWRKRKVKTDGRETHLFLCLTGVLDEIDQGEGLVTVRCLVWLEDHK